MLMILYIMIAIILAIIITCITIFFVNKSIQKKYQTFVLQNSVCLKQLEEINSRYDFYPYICFDQTHIYDNEKYFNMISCKDYLIYQLQYLWKKIYYQINKVNNNNQKYSEYLKEIQSITQFGQFNSPIKKLKLNKLLKTEHEIIEKQKYHPITQFHLLITLKCSTINGRIYNKKSEIFSANDILFLNKRLNDKNGYFYNDREIWDALCRVERGKVSNKMRFSVYQRDGYRCRKCGISCRYAQLEVDHIVPISKGGKSTYDNLQTLCHKCNVEKGNTTIKY